MLNVDGVSFSGYRSANALGRSAPTSAPISRDAAAPDRSLAESADEQMAKGIAALSDLSTWRFGRLDGLAMPRPPIEPGGEADVGRLRPDMKRGSVTHLATKPVSYFVPQLIDTIRDAMTASEAECVTPIKEALAKYVKYLSDVAEFTALIRSNISKGSDAQHITVAVGKLSAELQRLKAKWSQEIAFGPASYELVHRLSKQWRLPFSEMPDGTAIIRVHTAPLDAMIKATSDPNQDSNGRVDWLMGQHQAWSTSVSEQRQQVENECNLLSELARNGMALSNNLIKVLVSMIQTLYECNRQFAAGL
ncbi:IpaD/SipD/SspD family type III secretion system needle tip protein [Pararobbsia silviterrae]|uniref:Translocator protein BipD n=1 Tax=Pararobbsia silviterrae TaxID=1792498 RepID=A0A494XIG3_9BURK|nr:IpaD/SipD/SspD family type III secretion system needle tip protein [Pararobbsia silviterrae]RKP50348.1 IpaD/SipD/SspD family type III secretion system needle tip protein [Pararobbsia silviterrae]